jgi:hypothetical protein
MQEETGREKSVQEERERKTEGQGMNVIAD